MFVITLTYKVGAEKIDPLIEEHFAFLNKYYDEGLFIVSGRKEPRTGGVIITRNAARDHIETILQEDPFHRENVADYDIIEFVPGTIAKGFESIA